MPSPFHRSNVPCWVLNVCLMSLEWSKRIESVKHIFENSLSHVRFTLLLRISMREAKCLTACSLHEMPRHFHRSNVPRWILNVSMMSLEWSKRIESVLHIFENSLSHVQFALQ